MSAAGRQGEPAAARLWQVLRAAAAVCVVAAAGHWLFSDTFLYHSRAAGTGPLRVSFWGDYEEYRMWQEMLAAFSRKYPRIPVKAEYITTRYPHKIQQLLVNARSLKIAPRIGQPRGLVQQAGRPSVTCGPAADGTEQAADQC